MEQENFLLNRLDQPLRFLGVNKDEAFTFMGPLMMGFFLGYNATGVMSAIGLLAIYRTFKKRNEGAGLWGCLYWYFPTSHKAMKLYVPSHIREFIG